MWDVGVQVMRDVASSIRSRPQAAPLTVRPFLLTMKRKEEEVKKRKEVGKEAVLKRVGNAYVQKGNGFERENSNSERRGREREKHASDPCPNKVNQS